MFTLQIRFVETLLTDPERDTIKTQKDRGLARLAHEEHQEMLIVHFSAQT